MARDLDQWLQTHQAEIEKRWQAAARHTGRVSDATLQTLSPGSDRGLGLVLPQLSAVRADWTPISEWAQAISRSEFATLLGTLREISFDFLAQNVEPHQAIEYWQALGGRIDGLALAFSQAADSRLAATETERERWHTLYRLTRELSVSIDLGYVLQNTIRTVIELIGADRGVVLLLNEQNDLLTPKAELDWADVELDLAAVPSEWQRGRGSARILRAEGVAENPLKALVPGGDGAAIVAPLSPNGRFQGILAFATPNSRGFDGEHLDLIDAAVSSLEASLGSSEVIQTLNAQARELGLMLRQHQEDSSKREAILASIADGVVFIDQRGQTVLVNRAAEVILAKQADELIGSDLENLFGLFTADPRDDMLKAIKIVLANPEATVPVDALRTVLQIDNMIINAQWSPVLTKQGEYLGIVIVLRDITKEVEADRAKSEFVSTVSHELRTPMTAIKGYTDLLFSETIGGINDDQKRFLGIIRNNADRLTALISDLLDISRVETGRVRFEPEAVQLGDVVKSVIDVLTPNAEKKGHRLSYRVEAGLPEIMGDPGRLNQVFTNLIGNAINYTPGDGAIAVDVYRVQGAIQVDVTDDGIGIHPDDLSKIFERFYRADHPLVQESRGTGLGLPIVKLFTEMHGGRVWAESELSAGSTFTVLLPLPMTQLEDVPELLAPDIATRWEKRFVLVADDDRDIAELIRLQLEEAGFRVTAVGRGVKVLEVARRQRPDLIVLDILLPDMDGRAVLEALKSEPETADIPVVVLTILADDGTAFELGAAEYLTKPIDMEGLMQAVQTAISQRGRILVVEDDVDTFEMMRVALRRVGYNVDVAADGYEALSLARRWRPQAIVLDLRLPGMDGYETLAHLKRNLNTQDIPIIATSAHVADIQKETQRLESMGAQSFLPKPFTVNQLVTEIDQVVKKVQGTQSSESERELDE